MQNHNTIAIRWGRGPLRMSLTKLFSVWLLMLFPLIGYAAKIKLTHIQVTHSAATTQLIFTLSSTTQPHIFALSSPQRLVLDFEDTQLSTSLKKLHFANADIAGIRDGYPKRNTLRLVVDMNAPLRFKNISEKNSKQVIVNIMTTKKSGSQQPIVRKEVVTPVFKKAPSLALKKEVQKEFKPLPITVVIDPGHGGKDPGAIGDLGTKEKDVVLSIAKKLANLINQQPNMRAVLTRDGDYYVTLHDRLLLARKGKADLFIAIHADSYFNTRASGASVYSLSQHGASSIAARWLARRDNYSELGGVDLGDLEDQSYLLRSVLIDLAQTQTTKDSLRWGKTILSALEDVTKLHYSRVEQAPFMVLKSPDIPSLLIETGFISNSKEELRLRDKEYQRKIALALFNGIRSYSHSAAGA